MREGGRQALGGLVGVGVGVGVATATATATAKAFNRLAPAARLIDALYRRAGGFISFASPKETNQRKGAPRLRPSGVPCVGREPKVSLHSSALRNGRNPRWVRREVGKSKHPLVLLGRQKARARLLAVAHVPPSLQGEGPGVRMVCPGPLSSAEQRTSGAGFRRGLSEGAQRPSFAAADPIVRREGIPATPGRVCGAAFSLVRFFWPRKRNEPARTAAEGVKHRAAGARRLGVGVQARPVAKGVNQPRRRRSAFQKLKLPCSLPSHEGHQTTRAADARRLEVGVKARPAARNIKKATPQALGVPDIGSEAGSNISAQPPPSST